MKQQIAFIHNGEPVSGTIEVAQVPRIGEWVQLAYNREFKTYVVKHVLHKFPPKRPPNFESIHRIILILEEIKEEV